MIQRNVVDNIKYLENCGFFVENRDDYAELFHEIIEMQT
jgi:hypothetical protein